MTSLQQPSYDGDYIRELIHRRRRQVIVHSVLYYKLDSPLISDTTFGSWARELAVLQEEHRELSDEVAYMREAFCGFTGNTGFDLPLDDAAATATARRLVAYARTRQT
jgi:hypothetical protein